ncbi:PaaI family thioesterase [Enterovirga sp. CN4-39]|uniref:PaaI family thioesterase n=1 Tax=Enterovirga sp. CN4-39 TaxID=3400910 RepID=UPI003C0B24E8
MAGRSEMAAIFGAEIPFADHCEIEEIGFADGRTRLRMRLGPQHMNNVGIVHGGAICTLLDVSMGTAGRTHAGRPVMTLDMQVAFLAPGRSGVLFGEGSVLRAGRSILFCEAQVRDEAGELLAKSSGVFKPVK